MDTHETVVVLDFGSQYTQLIARRIREKKVYSVILPCTARVSEIIKHSPRALVLSGGDTASLVCRALGVRGIQLADEIVPGVPWGYLSGGVFDRALVATKSGGFGAPHALIQVADFFTCPKP